MISRHQQPNNVSTAGVDTAMANGRYSRRGKRHTDSHVCFGRRSPHRSPMLVACFVFALHLF
jgi:hypothetical protein